MDKDKYETTAKKSTIYINPKFNVHINPNFFNNAKAVATTSTATNIFVNPKFIFNLSNINGHQHQLPAVASENLPMPKANIIKKTARNLIRQPMLRPLTVQQNTVQINPLIKIGQRKLIRPVTIPQVAQSVNNVKVQVREIRSTSSTLNNIRSKYKIVNKKSENVYKIDRTLIKSKRVKLFNELLSPTKVIVTNYKLFRIGNPSPKLSTDRFISKANAYNLVNINGVLYKSTNTKLQKQSATPVVNNKSRHLNLSASACSLYVRGEKFVLHPSGEKLEHVPSDNRHTTNIKNRIYVGGLTYIPKSNNTYERANFHNTRLHLNVAKQKSINLLSKNLVKSNVSCPIYRKLGKCLGFQRGRCTKIHDINQVAICQKFLKGSCSDEQCLLSHNTSLSKMPTCKFFLLGECAKNDCAYLHKKVNDKTAICHEFLKGYCPKAGKCNLRHEFLCPIFESKGRCTITRCPYVHKVKSAVIPTDNRPPTTTTNHKTVTQSTTSSTSTNIESKRYFLNDSSTDNDMNGMLSKEANDKLDRALNKVARMRAHYSHDDMDEKGANESNRSTYQLIIEEDQPIFKRKKLGNLPSFIPID